MIFPGSSDRKKKKKKGDIMLSQIMTPNFTGPAKFHILVAEVSLTNVTETKDHKS